MSIFKFKQFDVDQSNCAMKVNTDGVLLGALAKADNPKSIVDIGTGTGVIALMLAQRFAGAQIDAIEIDAAAAATAKENFKNSAFNSRTHLFALGFEQFFDQHKDRRFDLIVSNPPFFLNSLTSPGEQKNLARHTNSAFFEKLVAATAKHLTDEGSCQLILPVATAELVKQLITRHQLHLQHIVSISSFADVDAHRQILSYGRMETTIAKHDFVIYAAQKTYSDEYKNALKDFLTIF